MPRFPYMNFPFPTYKTTSKSSGRFYTPTSNLVNAGFPNPLPISNSNINHGQKNENISKPEKKEQKNKSNNNLDNYLFDLFGLKIYYDDVLLVSLIYFLYSEGVKDDGLFLVLILLLLS